MKRSVSSRLVLSLSLLSTLAAGAVRAAEPIASAQEQARLLLSGNRFPAGDARPGSAVQRLGTSDSPTAEAQQLARQMILGRSAAAADTNASREADASPGREAGGDPLDLARRMILATPSKMDSATPRLAGKAK